MRGGGTLLGTKRGDRMTQVVTGVGTETCSSCGVVRAQASHLVCAPTGANICEKCVELAGRLIDEAGDKESDRS